MKMTTITHAYTADGTLIATPNPRYPAHCNPLLDEVDGAYQKNIETSRFFGNAYMEANPLKNLFFESMFALDRQNVRTGVYQDYQSVARYQTGSGYISSEMYLIKAECQLYTENGIAAMATINELRKERAISGTDNTLSGAATLETVLKERAIELCGEQQCWFDLKRTHILVDHVKEYNAQGSGQIKDIHYLRPIPQAQIDAVTNFSTVEGEGFWQNSGY